MNNKLNDLPSVLARSWNDDPKNYAMRECSRCGFNFYGPAARDTCWPCHDDYGQLENGHV